MSVLLGLAPGFLIESGRHFFKDILEEYYAE